MDGAFPVDERHRVDTRLLRNGVAAVPALCPSSCPQERKARRPTNVQVVIVLSRNMRKVPKAYKKFLKDAAKVSLIVLQFTDRATQFSEDL